MYTAYYYNVNRGTNNMQCSPEETSVYYTVTICNVVWRRLASTTVTTCNVVLRRLASTTVTILIYMKSVSLQNGNDLMSDFFAV